MNHRRHRSSARRELLLTSVIIAAVGAAAWLSLRARDGLPGLTRYTVAARFSDLANLRAHDDVRIAGVRVGQVLDPRRDAGGARVTLSLDPSVRLSSDTRATVRSRGVLGARYLELRPGTSATQIPEGGTVELDRTSAAGDIADILATFDARTRRNLRTLVDGAGRGLLARGPDLNGLLADAPPLTHDIAAVAAAINARPGAARRLTPSVAATMDAIAPVARPLGRSVAAQEQAAAPFAARQADVSRTLRVAPGALHDVRGSLARTSPLFDAAGNLLHTVRASLEGAPAGLTQTAALLRSTRRSLARTAVALDAATAAVPPTRAALRVLPPLLTMLDDTVTQSTPLLRKIAAIQCDIHAFATGWQSMLGVAVKNRAHDEQLGPLTSLRLTVTGTPATLKPAVTAATGTRLIGSDPYPAPCKAGTEKVG